jgi:hypothetical protein
MRCSEMSSILASVGLDRVYAVVWYEPYVVTFLLRFFLIEQVSAKSYRVAGLSGCAPFSHGLQREIKVDSPC